MGFALVIAKLHFEGAFTGPGGIPPAVVLAGTFLLGTITKVLLGWAWRVLPVIVQNVFGHLVAAATLVIVTSYCLVVVFEPGTHLPPVFEALFLGTVGFYLGER